MESISINIRLMAASDFDAVLAIDQKVLKFARLAYYEMKFDKLFKSKEFLPTSLLAELADGTVVGFIMGELYMGEYGISRDGATLDTVGVDPEYRKLGIGKRLMQNFIAHLKDLGVKKLNTLVDTNDINLLNFFEANNFKPAKNIINLERSI